MSKLTQNFRLYTLLQSGEAITKETIRDTLGVEMNSVPVYIFELKKHFKADIEAVRDGRKVIAYKLVNKIKVPQFRSNNIQFVKNTDAVPAIKQADGSVAVLEDLDAVVMNETEMDDVKSALGLNDYSSTHYGRSYNE